MVTVWVEFCIGTRCPDCDTEFTLQLDPLEREDFELINLLEANENHRPAGGGPMCSPDDTKVFYVTFFTIEGSEGYSITRTDWQYIEELEVQDLELYCREFFGLTI